MALLFSGALTSSPIRKRESLADQSCHSLSLLSPDLTYECFSINPLTGSPCSCRRSPRLLSNGYYVLTEDSYVFDDDGNVSLTPSKTNVSYKENLVRIFRRRRRSRRSLASLFGVTSSWLESSVFEAVYRPPLGESSWSEGSTSGLTKDCDFTYDHSTPQKPGHVSCLKEEGELSALDTEACFSKEQFSQSLGGFLDVPPPSPFNAKSCCQHKPSPSDSAMVTAFVLIFLTICLFTALFSRSLLAGVAVGLITFTLILTSFFYIQDDQSENRGYQLKKRIDERKAAVGFKAACQERNTSGRRTMRQTLEKEDQSDKSHCIWIISEMYVNISTITCHVWERFLSMVITGIKFRLSIRVFYILEVNKILLILVNELYKIGIITSVK